MKKIKVTFTPDVSDQTSGVLFPLKWFKIRTISTSPVRDSPHRRSQR